MIDPTAPVVPSAGTAAPVGSDFKPDTWRGDASRHRVGQTQDGRWWWVQPSTGPVFIAGLAGVEHAVGAQSVIGQLRTWGFNLLLPPAAEGFCNRGVAHVAVLNLSRAGDRMIRQGGVALPDVFDPRWAEAVAHCAGVAAPTAGLAAYVPDLDLRWGGDAPAGEPLPRTSLLQVCLSLDPVHGAYHAAWEFVLATRAGGLGELARNWAVALPNKETLRQMTANDEVIDSPGFRLDHERFLREYAQRYYRVVAEALRGADDSRLWISAPLSAQTPAVVRANAAAVADVVLVREAGLGGGRAPELVWPVEAETWTARRRVLDPVAMSDLERQLAHTRETLLAWCEAPQVIGYVWSRYTGGDQAQDGPTGLALIDENGQVNHARVSPLTAFNRQAVAVRAALGVS